jgi:hypothetical protein
LTKGGGGSQAPVASDRASPIDLGRKDGAHVIVFIGSNDGPIVPRSTDDPCTVALAFEPIVSDLIPSHPGLHVIPAAVSGQGGWASMFIYNTLGVSSSLSKPSHEGWWNKGGGSLKVVPLISFRTVLESLRKYQIDIIVTDMQGHDFEAVSSVGGLLKEAGVKRLITEIYTDNVATYEGVNNDLCQDWLPHMTSIGYIFEGLKHEKAGYRNAEELEITCKKALATSGGAPKAGNKEGDAYWRLEGEEPSISDHKVYDYPTHSKRKTGIEFTAEEYAKCRM